MTREEITKQEVDCIQDIMALKPYYDSYPEVRAEMRELSIKRSDLRSMWKEAKKNENTR